MDLSLGLGEWEYHWQKVGGIKWDQSWGNESRRQKFWDSTGITKHGPIASAQESMLQFPSWKEIVIKPHPAEGNCAEGWKQTKKGLSFLPRGLLSLTGYYC